MQKALYVALDVHKVSISATVAEDGREGGVSFMGAVPNTPAALSKLSKRLAKTAIDWSSVTKPASAATASIGS